MITDGQVVERLSQGRSFINYSGHGGTDYWVAPRVTSKDVRTFTDRNALPVVISNSCDTGKFTKESFGEAWQTHPSGSILFWGSMDSSYWDEDDILQKRQYDAMYARRQLQFTKNSDAGLNAVWTYYGGEKRSKYYMETWISAIDITLTSVTGLIFYYYAFIAQ